MDRDQARGVKRIQFSMRMPLTAEGVPPFRLVREEGDLYSLEDSRGAGCIFIGTKTDTENTRLCFGKDLVEEIKKNLEQA